jgi:hypothetical protein
MLGIIEIIDFVMGKDLLITSIIRDTSQIEE